MEGRKKGGKGKVKREKERKGNGENGVIQVRCCK